MGAARNGIIVRTDDQSVICAAAVRADTMRLRLCGLLGTEGLAEDAGLLITPSSGVHTFGMRFSIDVVTMDKNFRVLGLWESVGPGKVRGLGWRTRNVLELRGGRLQACDLAIGDQLLFTPAEHRIC